MPEKIISLKHIAKTYKFKVKELKVLTDVNLDMEIGEMVAIQGKSGAGKTTLLNIISGIIKPTAGEIYFAGKKTNRMFDFSTASFRSKDIGFVFQNFNLIPYQSVLENVTAPLKFSYYRSLFHKKEARKALEVVGLLPWQNYYPNLLSGGQMQRVAIARAVVKNPRLIIADEPTGNLDLRTAEEIHNLFLKLNKEQNISFIIVTHSPDIAKTASKTYILEDGQLHLQN